ncbi:Uncharacterised protein [uncultured archaeon]|nr:Uncharacterised protein [uncultured archaeon]
MVEPKKKIDISAKKTEAGWGEANDKFYLYATQLWFDWLKWMIILGAIKVVAATTRDPIVQLIESISYVFFMMYMLGFFWRFEFHGIPRINNERTRLILSLILSLLLTVGTFNVLSHLATVMELDSRHQSGEATNLKDELEQLKIKYNQSIVEASKLKKDLDESRTINQQLQSKLIKNASSKSGQG